MSEADYLNDGSDYIISDYKFWVDKSKPNKNGLYKCTLCGKYKRKSDFYKDKRVPCGIRSRCKECYHKNK